MPQAGTAWSSSLNGMDAPLIHAAGHDPMPVVGHVDQQAAQIHFRQLGRDFVFGKGAQQGMIKIVAQLFRFISRVLIDYGPGFFRGIGSQQIHDEHGGPGLG